MTRARIDCPADEPPAAAGPEPEVEPHGSRAEAGGELSIETEPGASSSSSA